MVQTVTMGSALGMQLGKASWDFGKAIAAKLAVWFMAFCNAHQHNSQPTAK